MSLGCSGFVYGLATAYSFIESGLDNILLCVGDVASKFVNPNDHVVAPLMGDAGSAILIQRSPSKSIFNLYSDGSGYDALIIPNSGVRIEKKFEDIIETFGTAIPSQIKSYKIEKYEILTPIKFNSKVNKGEIIANLKTRKIIAPFDGIIGKRDFSDDILVSKSSILLNLEDTTIIFSDVEIPEVYAPFIKNGLPVDVIFSGYKNKIYSGIVDSTLYLLSFP